ncbi:hypothetical protein M378DRAFT_156426 [Amanita muscaria Koide BX008]|uniref:Mitochondrial distribution and morphology protein 34 n=1 Tax=Amanita muscaria (strain Koide BX008) TaxID=946122 RepID=A0A0C2XLB4_AMAMK|nr:hypothetical protein M378DRAFT_156426 [Amanita muscaria Koide BX008]
MSFSFNWPRFSDQFHHDAIQMLNNALNKGNKPPVIADKIEVVELNMGTQPPDLEIRDIGDLAMDHFRGIFRMTYAGDAHLVLKTKVQANPLNHKQPDIHLMTGSQGMLAAKQPLVVPMLLRLSHFKLSSYVVLVISKQKGITLVFKTDPLQHVDINSTFDSIAVIQKFIQREIEGQLRQMFREDLPGIIHRLSQQWVKAKVEAPYLTKRPPVSTRQPPLDTLSLPDLSRPSLGSARPAQRPESLGISPEYRRPRSVSGMSSRSASRPPKSDSSGSQKPGPSSAQADQLSFPDIENYDPTYGLRPEGLPTKSGFRHFSSLFAPNKGLADLAEEPADEEEEDYDYDEVTSFDMVDWDDTIPDLSSPPTEDGDRQSVREYETIPAVGGGTITRPRVIHAQSRIQLPGSSPLDSPSLSPRTLLYSGPASATTQSHSSYFPDSSPRPRLLPMHDDLGDSSRPLPTTSSPHSVPRFVNRRLSVSSTTSIAQPPFSFSPGTSPPNDSSSSPGNSKIVVRPSLMNNSIRHLSTLSHSNHTLSPYTRSLAHFTVRSVPPRQIAHSYSFEKQPVKAKRKRTYRLGGAKQQQQTSKPESTAPSDRDSDVHPYHPSSSPPPSEFDASDMDLYFRHRDDMVPSDRQSSSSSFSQSTHHVRKRYPPLAIPQRHPRI